MLVFWLEHVVLKHHGPTHPIPVHPTSDTQGRAARSGDAGAATRRTGAAKTTAEVYEEEAGQATEQRGHEI